MRELPQDLTPPLNGDAIETEITDIQLSRRAVLSRGRALALLGVAGCSTAGGGLPALELDDTVTGSVRPIRPAISVDKNITGPDVMYASLTDGGFQVPEVPYLKVKPEFRRQIVVDTTARRPAPSSFTCRSACSISSSRVATPSATASASARTASAGPAAPTSSTARNGRCGRRHRK